ncbi:MAG: UDP-N-acetylglucosamine 2-epimerase (hydrolyzing) [Burkholderiales bacterium]|nr:UDP-N-acetylglucosamine 2-epimerase (hydrolyzing) [Burkholderiales bacterium]
MTGPRTILVATGSRAEYGLMRWLMKEIAADPALRLQVLATGAHLAPGLGMTVREIEADGFAIDARVPIALDSDEPAAIARSMGLAAAGVADAIVRLAPDLMVVLGDRYEILAAAAAAVVARVPLAHIHGGEVTEGAYDDAIRHAITKLAHWHFVAAEPYRKRVVQMGEPPQRVFNCGAPALDGIARLERLTRGELETALGMRLGRPLVLATCHPETLARGDPLAAGRALIVALERMPHASVVFTYPNADTGGRALIEAIERFVARRGDAARAFASLGQVRYLNLMREADLVAGNSSSALVEAPALGTATVNIGERQHGRLKASSVIDAPAEPDAIGRAIQSALSPAFRERLPRTVSLYGEPGASARIKDLLKTVDIAARKAFFDIEHPC